MSRATNYNSQTHFHPAFLFLHSVFRFLLQQAAEWGGNVSGVDTEGEKSPVSSPSRHEHTERCWVIQWSPWWGVKRDWENKREWNWEIAIGGKNKRERQEVDMVYLTARKVNYLKLVELRPPLRTVYQKHSQSFSSPWPPLFKLLSPSLWLLLRSMKEVCSKALTERQRESNPIITKIKNTKEDKWRHCMIFFLHIQRQWGPCNFVKGGRPHSLPDNEKQTGFSTQPGWDM